MVVYALVNYCGYYGGDYDDMNNDVTDCRGLYSTTDKAFEALRLCMSKVIEEYAEDDEQVSFAEEDPLKHSNCIAYYSMVNSNVIDDESDWNDYAIITCELDSEPIIGGALF